LRVKLALRQVSFDPPALGPFRLEQDDRGRPDGAEAPEERRLLLDVDVDRYERLLDEGSDVGVGVGFGFQPNAGSSGGSGAEVEQ
jgi:hypothetical protein